ncbi:ABC transporter ATP-binding protein [Chelatococcus asaccharovorans]|uniref:ABC transporter ATP-binding protein n=1 Tax=Chelatococcus asaccharovorans TaxID=28210 RepID=UPI00224C73B0|nr:ABC transporter ATP-binding protein [Chelatococcus asaccharovorans]CAH1652404.1 Fe(3+) ions import ATP-binding protein FbpC [Chelatococcus asaccharovorans]CAH1686347.1 Fe(3+) ions import ATP-binding protein FbpC [Chelatococcus asaccharovorans]
MQQTLAKAPVHAPAESPAASASPSPAKAPGQTLAKALSIRHLDKSYALGGGRRLPVVTDFNLDLAPGEFVTLLGPSGCGKTTVLRTLAGLEDFESGEILLDSRSIARLPAHHRKIGLVFQNYALFPHMSVFENVAYSLRLRRVAEATVRSEVASALAAVGLEDYGPRMPGQLSGGQQQRVAVARALVMHPDLLLFDEPLSNLDAKLRVQVRSELRRLQRRLGTTALFVTHDQDEAMSLSDRIAVMKSGRIEQVGAPEEIYARPATLFVAQFVGKVNALPATIVGEANGQVEIEMLGTRLRAPSPATGLPRDVLALLRPEAVTLGGPDSGLPGIVEDIEFLGDLTEYGIRVGDSLVTSVRSALGDAWKIREGDRVGIGFKEQTIHLLPRTEAAV